MDSPENGPLCPVAILLYLDCHKAISQCGFYTQKNPKASQSYPHLMYEAQEFQMLLA